AGRSLGAKGHLMAAVIALLAAFGLAFADQGPIESAAAAPPVVRTRRRGPATQHRARRHASRIAELSEAAGPVRFMFGVRP
ncbi:MAG: hypothetical protein ACRDOX_02350, partial [Nocardioides sp.]